MADEGALSGVGEIDYEDYLFEQKFGMPRAQYEKEQGTIQNSMTPTRDKLNVFLEENTPLNPNQVDNLIGGQGRGFLDMGLSDVTVFPMLLDSYDAYNRLQKTRKTDEFSDSEEGVITSSPFILKVANILSSKDNRFKDYYDGKKSDIATIAFGPLGFLGMKAGALKILSKFKKGAMYK